MLSKILRKKKDLENFDSYKKQTCGTSRDQPITKEQNFLIEFISQDIAL